MGPLVDSSAGNQIGFFRVDDSLTEKFGVDPSSGKSSPHLEMIPGNGISGVPPPTGNYFSLGLVVVSPASRGAVTINNTDPFSAPLINPRYFTSPFDIAAMRQAIRMALQFSSTPTWNGYILAQFGPFANITLHSNDSVLDAFIRDSTSSVAHPVGTVAMSARGAEYGVVDPDLRVKGVEGLRVIDASVFPFITSSHTQAPTYVVGERGAELIKVAWSG